MNISKLAINRPTLIVVIFSTLLFLGFFSYRNLNSELMPNMTVPGFIVMAPYPGASPSEVENNVTKKLEEIVGSVANIEHIQSTSSEGASFLGISLKMSANVDDAIRDAQQRISAARDQLPENISDPMISKISLGDMPIMSIGVTSSLDETLFYDLINTKIKPELARIKGIGEIVITGGREREFLVSLDPDKLNERHLTAEQVLMAIQTSNMNFPTGKVQSEASQMAIRLSAKINNVNDINQVVVQRLPDGAKIYLKDVANVLDTEKELTTITRVDGINSIGLSVKKMSDANAVEMCQAVRNQLAQLEQTYQHDNLKFAIPFDSSIFTREASESVMHDLFFAVILVSLVMLVFLHGLRNAFIVMISIPLSIVTSFLGMYLLGYTLNIMTLLAMSLVIGILVDDAIVVLENIYRHMEMGKNRKQATIDGRAEISFTAIAITLVDVVVFLPIGLSSGFVSMLIGPFAIVVVVTTLLSLFVAFTAIPLLSSRFAKLSHLKPTTLSGRFFLGFENRIDDLGRFIQKILMKAMRHRILTFVIVTLLFIGSFMLIPAGFVGSEAFGLGDAGEFILRVELPKDATLKQTNLKALEIENLLRQKKEVKSMFTTIGVSGSNNSSIGDANKAEINIKLVGKEQRNMSSQVYANAVKNELRTSITGAKITTSIVNPFFGSSDDSPVQVIVTSENPDSLHKYAGVLKNIIDQTPGVNDVTSSLDNTADEIEVNIDKQKMADLGLDMTSVGAVMATAFAGNTDNKLTDGNYQYDIRVIYDQFNRKALNDVSELTFVNAESQLVKLKQFADIRYTQGSTKLERYDRNSSITIQSQVLGRASGNVGDEIKQKIESINFPSNVSIHYGGDMETSSDAMGSLGYALLIAIFLVYMVMVALYESYMYPFVVLFTIPLAIIGAIWALALTKSTIGVFSMMGMIMLIGLMAKNAILVVDFANHLKKQGKNTAQALVAATKTRLRPVLMTTVAMIIGLLPIALASGAASEWKNGIAWALIGGLTSSMFLTLIVVPVMFITLENAKNRAISFFRRLSGKTKQPVPELV